MRKGIILAGGKGTRLAPLTTGVSKQLLPVYDKPLIYYPISTLLNFGIRHILIICSNVGDLAKFFKLTAAIDAKFEFEIQKEPKGLVDSFLIGEEFIGEDDVSLILGDNIFDGRFDKLGAKNTIYGVKVKNPQNYGVLDLESKRVLEKPDNPPSDLAIPGLYHFDNKVVKKAKKVKPSGRGELEIADLINLYLKNDVMNITILPDEMAWFDCGTFDHLLEAGNYVKAIQNRTSRIIGKV